MKIIRSMALNSFITKVACSIVLLSCVAFSKAKASHLAAADIYLTYVGAGADGCSATAEYKYVITLDIYRACERTSAGLGTQENVTYGSVNSGVPNTTLTMRFPQIDTLDGLCETFKKDNSCRFPNNDSLPGFIRHRYTDTIILPSAQTDWRFWWTSCCRNSGIQNLTNTGSIYVEAGLNNLAKYNNSTPRFLVSPLPYICINQPATYLNGPYDVNGDSMYVQVQEPLQGAANPIAYLAANGYTLADPMGSAASNPFTFNTTTGTAKYTPTLEGKFVMAFRCDEYERGTGINLGYIMRDVQVSVFKCSAPPPPVDSLPLSISSGAIVKGPQGDMVLVCPGSPLRFDMSATSANTTSNVYMEANTNVIPGSSFTTTGAGTNSVTGTFSWTPTVSDIGEHTLIITGKDSTCSGAGFSIVLKNYTVLTIVVTGGLDAGPDLPICQLNPTPRQLFVKGTDFVTVNWTDINGGPAIGLNNSSIHNPIATTTRTTSYVVSSPELKGNCKNRDTVSVFIDTSNKITTIPKSPIIQCRPDYIQLEAFIAGKPPQSNVPCGVSNPTSCATPDEATVFGSSVYGTVPYDTIGATTPVFDNKVYSMKRQYLIRKADLWESGLRSATINSLSIELDKSTLATHRYNNFTISIKCTNKDELTTNGGFENGLVQVYSSANEFMPNGWKEFVFNTPYNWDTTRNLIVEMCYSNNDSVVISCNSTSGQSPIVKFSPTTYVSGLVLLPNDTFTKSVCNVNNSSLIEAVQARPIFRFKYCEANPQPFVVNWSPGEFLSDSTIRQPLAYAPATKDYVVETFGRSGCIVRDTVGIYVPKHDFKIFPEDTAVCYNDGVPFKVYNGFTYNWYEYKDGKYLNAEKSLSCVDCPDPIATPKKSTVYRVAISDSVWCYDTVEARVTIMPLPDVRILNKDDSTIKYGQSFKLLATGARTYNWSPVSSLTNPNISYPIATPKEATRYIVGGIGLNGCRAFDTLHVSVDYRDNLFVPTAFSPNGDGKNDLFKVSNLSFQRVMEFRVFNRWGQEIFSGAGPNVAWNGTWKGEPQDMGNYSYIIRVGFPDGYVETYKGEVTLIR
ncbi:MAG: gliding motility-associated C-terminal domain-containing protein [Flavipsychrobacter sp.]